MGGSGIKNLKITVITPSLNQGHFIEQTIQSVLSQNYPDLEYIIIDGGSTDNTPDIIQKYKNKITYISEKDNGQTEAINKGLRMSSGDIITYLNSDDLYLPDTLTHINSFFKLNPYAKWVTGDYIIIDEKNKKIQSFVVTYKRLLRFIPTFTMLSFTNFVVQSSTFCRREVIDETGFFDVSLHYAMDYDYWLRIIKQYPLYVINKPLSAFRIHKSSKSSCKYQMQFKEDLYISTKHSNNKLIHVMHKIHNHLIVLSYKLLK